MHTVGQLCVILLLCSFVYTVAGCRADDVSRRWALKVVKTLSAGLICALTGESKECSMVEFILSEIEEQLAHNDCTVTAIAFKRYKSPSMVKYLEIITLVISIMAMRRLCWSFHYEKKMCLCGICVYAFFINLNLLIDDECDWCHNSSCSLCHTLSSCP